MTHRSRLVLTALAAGSLAGAQMRFAQTEGPLGKKPEPWFHARPEKGRDPDSRTLSGTVLRADDSPAAGATVKVRNRGTGELAVYAADGKGAYRFAGLSMKSDYDVWAEYRNRKTRVYVLSTLAAQRDASITLKFPADAAKSTNRNPSP